MSYSTCGGGGEGEQYNELLLADFALEVPPAASLGGEPGNRINTTAIIVFHTTSIALADDETRYF